MIEEVVPLLEDFVALFVLTDQDLGPSAGLRVETLNVSEVSGTR